MNGLQCWLSVGKAAPKEFRDSCIAIAAGHPIFVVPDAGKSMFAVVKETAKKGTPSKGVLRTFEQWKTLHGKK